jgi:hypothetical protein
MFVDIDVTSSCRRVVVLVVFVRPDPHRVVVVPSSRRHVGRRRASSTQAAEGVNEIW